MFRNFRAVFFGTLGVASLLPLLGCGGGGNKSAPSLVYRLAEADSRALPATIFDGMVPEEERPVRYLIETTEGTLELLPDQRYRHEVLCRRYREGRPDGRYRHYDYGRYSTDGDRMSFVSEFVQNRAFQATHSGTSIVGEQDILGEGIRNRFTFRR
ncbi:MAG: hypothetical protein SFU56_18780 [Capsulimonadales bacterium]|nr:hypothetical protein [Capsulimonadales bacterium]